MYKLICLSFHLCAADKVVFPHLWGVVLIGKMLYPMLHFGLPKEVVSSPSLDPSLHRSASDNIEHVGTSVSSPTLRNRSPFSDEGGSLGAPDVFSQSSTPP
ncbi:hypothetical protein AB205_0147250 [Aquarana catesbeiana]|uniref:Uncharacterized protein n=1 Tax=Aquarana catesbeiana TaxID=8400 RepID=A0A2G9S273_AQUCT|nr:hypothetical protein AB205_0147250 [Aquarana catesbeiana]